MPPRTADLAGVTRRRLLDDAIAMLATWPDTSTAALRVTVVPGAEGPTVEVEGDRVRIAAGSADDLPSVVLALREALARRAMEASTRSPGEAPHPATRILPHVTAVADAAVVHRLDLGRTGVTSSRVVDGVRTLIDALPNPSWAERRSVAAVVAAHLHERDGDESCLDAAVLDRVAQAVVLALPTSVLLASGGKDGQAVDWTCGLNRYGVTPLPQPWITRLASCTASSPSEDAYAAACRVRTELLARALEGGLDDALERRWHDVRSELARAVGVGDGLVLPTPSGTDAETVATAIAAAVGRPVTTIVVGPLEVGSGTVQASLGRSFSTLAPNGRSTEPGALLDGMPADVELMTVEVRDHAGHPRRVEDVEAELAACIADIAARGRHALLHTIDGSKTGVRVPREATVRAWEDRHGPDLDVIVDAAQLRVDDGAVDRHLAAGRMVIVTGSKFFSGPPFCGALLLPRRLGERLVDAEVPVGLADYLDQWAVPPSLRDLRSVAPPAPNLGLLLRWTAALAEMRAFLRIPPARRDAIVRELSELVEDAILATPGVELVPSAAPTVVGSDRDDPPATIFTLRLRRDGRYLEDAELRLAQAAMRQDLSRAAPPDLDLAARVALSRRAEIGQPVPLGPDGQGGAGIRLAYGAPTITRIAFDPQRGAELSDRVLREVAETVEALTKLALLLWRWDELSDPGPAVG